MHIRSGDLVQVMTGADRDSQGRVLKIDREAGKLVVEGVNRVYKHVRRSQKHPQGGRLSKEMPVQTSNVLLICESCKQPARTGARVLADGAKERFCKKCGANLGQISPPRELATKNKK